MANSRYNRLDNQAPVQTSLKADDVSVGRSAHDFSRIHSGNTLFGLIAPVDCFDVVPNEDLDINLTALLEFRNPTTRQLLNGCRVYFHAYYNRLTDLWEGAQNWIDNGRSGKLSLTRPNLIYHLSVCGRSDSSSTLYPVFSVNACTPLSLLNFLGLPAERQPATLNTTIPTPISQPTPISVDSAYPPLRSFQAATKSLRTNSGKPALSDIVLNNISTDFFPADCCMAYQRNWRDFYSNKNLLQTNKYWFPDNESHFILSYDCENAVCINYENETLGSDIVFDGSIATPNAQFPDKTQVSSMSIFQNLSYYYAFLGTTEPPPVFAKFDYTKVTPEPNNPSSVADPDGDDYVSLHSPNLAGIKFRQFRGDRFTTALPFPDLIRGDIPILSLTNDFIKLSRKNTQDSTVVEAEVRNQTNNGDTRDLIDVALPLSVQSQLYQYGIDFSAVGASITMSDLYTLETLTNFRRRFAMTNGDYNESIKSQFGVNPHAPTHEGTYIGGFYQDFAFSSVTQTSESSESPLGTKAGQGISAGNGRIGHFHTPDYGWIQIYMIVVPDVMYTNGKPRMFSKKSNLEMYFPIFNNLPAQAILNKELYISGDTAIDNDVFAYEDRYAEYKSRGNYVSGFMALTHVQAAFDSSRIMSRRFTSTPALNHQFVTMVPENIDMEVFTVFDEPPFDFSVGINIRRVFPGPYTAIEGSLSSPALNRV